MSCALHRKSLFIKAVNGSGKTTILKHLARVIPVSAYSQARPASAVINSLAVALNIKAGRAYELKQKVIDAVNHKNCTLLLDDVHELTNSVRSLVEKLMAHGVTIICAGSNNILGLHQTIMPSLSREQLSSIIEGQGINHDLAARLALNCRTPAEAVLVARKAMFNDSSTSEKKHEFVKSLRNRKSLPLKELSAVASILLSARYVCYLLHEFATGYLLAAIAYAVLCVYRLKR